MTTRARMPIEPLILLWEDVLSQVPLDEDEIRQQIVDGRFPKPRQLSPKKIGWIASEVAQWLQDLPEREANPPQLEAELYRHFDAAGRLLYVGVSLSTTVRLMAHMARADWADQIATITVERFYSRTAALHAERTAIKAEKPLHNIIHAERKC